MIELTLNLDESASVSVLHALAGVLTMASVERRTPAGRLTYTAKAENSFAWTDDARKAFTDAAAQIRAQADELQVPA